MATSTIVLIVGGAMLCVGFVALILNFFGLIGGDKSLEKMGASLIAHIVLGFVTWLGLITCLVGVVMKLIDYAKS